MASTNGRQVWMVHSREQLLPVFVWMMAAAVGRGLAGLSFLHLGGV